MVYAGGVIILYIFSILLTSTDKESKSPMFSLRRWLALLASIGGICLVSFLLLTNVWPTVYEPSTAEVPMKLIGKTLMGTEKGQFLLPFEVMSVLLLACMVGGILIARKRG